MQESASSSNAGPMLDPAPEPTERPVPPETSGPRIVRAAVLTPEPVPPQQPAGDRDDESGIPWNSAISALWSLLFLLLLYVARKEERRRLLSGQFSRLSRD